jgi:hypothetical protein
MKYVLFWETPGEPMPQAQNQKAIEARLDEKKYGKTILQPHFYSKNQGLSIVELDNVGQLANRRALAHPVTIKAMPLLLGTDMGKAMLEHGKTK